MTKRARANAIELQPSVGWGQGRGRIAIAGAGARIVVDAHIPSYRRLGVDIDLIFDPDPERLRLAAAAVERTGGTTRAIHDREAFLTALRDANPDLMDVAVPSPVHTAFLSGLFDDLGKDCPPLLVQKPLAEDSVAARGLVARARDLDVRMLMQMNGRWVPTFRELRDAVRSGTLGDIQVVEVLNRGLNPKTPDDWRSHIDRLIGYEMAIHHVDLLIWMFGLPDWVFAVYRHVPGFVVKADNFAVMTMGFGESLVANVVEDWTCRVKDAWHLHPSGEHFVVSGTRGTAFATPHATDDRGRRGDADVHERDALVPGRLRRSDGGSPGRAARGPCQRHRRRRSRRPLERARLPLPLRQREESGDGLRRVFPHPGPGKGLWRFKPKLNLTCRPRTACRTRHAPCR